MSFLIQRAIQIVTLRAQCRHLHLVHEIFTKYPNGKLAACEKQNLNIQPKPFTICKPSGDVTVSNVKEALEHIEPMTHLTKVGGQQTYQISKLNPPPPTPDKQPGGKQETAGCRDGNAREFHLKTNASSTYLAHVLSKAYQVLSFRNIDLRRVEFHVTTEDDFSIEWLLENCPHLRPEMILAAMPPETIVLAPPLADGRHKLMWALYKTQLPAEARDKVFRNARLQSKGLLHEASNLAVEVKGLKVNDAIGKTATDERAFDLSSESANIDKLQIVPSPLRQRGEEITPHNVLRNEQTWNKPSKKFQRAWKKEAYQTSKRCLVKQQMRHAQAEDQLQSKAKGKYSSKLKKKW